MAGSFTALFVHIMSGVFNFQINECCKRTKVFFQNFMTYLEEGPKFLLIYFQHCIHLALFRIVMHCVNTYMPRTAPLLAVHLICYDSKQILGVI